MVQEQIKILLEKERAEDFESAAIFCGDLQVYVRKEHLLDLCRYLMAEESLKLNFLSMITAADYLGRKDKRFEVVYSLYSIAYHHRLMLKLRLTENEDAPSLTSLWDTADWQEREVFDMFGIKFIGHPDLRRILMDDDWVGYPQRKDFPLTYEMPEFSHNRGQIDLRKRDPERETP